MVKQSPLAKKRQKKQRTPFGGKLLILGVLIFVGTIGLVGIIAFLNSGDQGLRPQIRASGNIGTSVGDVAPEFTVRDIDGRQLRLSDLRGKPTYIAFAASWCTPCQVEARNLRNAVLGEGYEINAVVFDIDPNERGEDMARWNSLYGMDNWIMVMDSRGEVAFEYKVQALDTTLILDGEGIIRYRDEGWIADTQIFRRELGKIFSGDGQPVSQELSKIGELGSVHEHADFRVALNGRLIDFSLEEYQLRSSFVHFEGGDSDVIHKHATGITLGYFFETLGMELTQTCLILDSGDIYCNSVENTLLVLVDGEIKSRPQDYEFKDSDSILIFYGRASEDEIQQFLP